MFFYSFCSILTLLKLIRRKGISLIHAQDLSFSGFAGVVVSKLFKIPLVLHSHGPPMYVLDKSFRQSVIWRITERTLNRITINNAGLIVVTDLKTERFVKSFVRKQGQPKIVRIPTAIDTRYYQMNKEDIESQPHDNEVLLGFIGRLNLQKNPETILRAFSKLGHKSRVKLYIAGDGPLRADLEKEARQLNISGKVTFYGAVSESKKLELLRDIDIFIIPSVVEGCPIALLEAMAAGKAIIAGDIPSIREVVVGDEAVLVHPYDSDKLAHTLSFLCNDPISRKNLGIKALNRAKFYDVQKIYSQMQQLYLKQIALQHKQVNE